jgi:hypothetical protein
MSDDVSMNLVLNFSPVYFENAEVQGEILEYQGREHLRVLRSEYNATHVFYRDGGTRLLCVPVASDAPEIGNCSTTIRLADNLYLSAALVRNALIDYFHKLGQQILTYNPIKFIAVGSSNNLLAASVPKGVPCPSELSVRVLYEMNVRVFKLDHQKPFIGLALDVRTARLIKYPCDKLIDEGVPLNGLYVGRLVPRGDVRMAPRFELLGRVQKIHQKQLFLTDERPGFGSIHASEAVLEPRYHAFDLCLTHVFRERATQVKSALDSHLAKLRGGPGRFDKLLAAIEHLAHRHLEMVPGVSFTLQPFLSEESGELFPAVQSAPTPTYVFDPAGNYTDTWHDRGLNEYGPYTAQSFTPSRPRICVVCEKTRKGQVEQFLHKFFSGIRPPNVDRPPFAKGFTRKYAIEECSTEFFLVANTTAEAYRKASLRAIEWQTQHNFKWDLALIQVDERTQDFHGVDSPYLITKSNFLMHQIPVQEFKTKTVDIPDKQLGYVLNSMALATYAKLGGIPWLIKALPTIAHELVIGLGSAFIGRGRLGGRKQVVGITTVFTGDGNYWLSNLSRAVPIADYQDALLESLRDTINRVQRSMNWQPGEHIRLIFHAFKPLKNTEADAVKALMAELGNYDVDYAFVHVIQDHPYILLDKGQRGVWDYESRTSKGVYAPMRGLFLRLSNHEVLISLIGTREVKRSQDGLPHPIFLRLHRSSTFQDTTYLARQVFAFSCHSWRSFLPAPMPVTILYSKLVAKMLGQLETLPGWNSDILVGRIGETRWFL